MTALPSLASLGRTQCSAFSNCDEPRLGVLYCQMAMPKRNLRVVKWLGTVPAIGVCAFCNREFKVPMTALKRVADAQEALRLQFAAHKCKSADEQPVTPNLAVSVFGAR